MSNSTVIEVKNLWAWYDKSPVIYDVDFEVHNGRIVGIVGPNGAGKSTLVKAMIGLIHKHQGDIRFFGQARSKKSLKKIAYVPQKEAIDWDFPVTVADVVLMGRYGHLGLLKRPSERDYEIVNESLEKVSMSDFKHRQISELSGGQQQRVFIARALAQEAEIYLMDEPFAGVDAKTERAIIDLMHNIKETNKTIIVIHHDLSSVKDYFDDVLLLNRQIVAQGPVEEVFTVDNLQKTYEGHLHVLKSGDAF